MSFKYFLGTVMLLTSNLALADFTLPGKGEISYPTGVTKPFEFGFAWNEKEQSFTIGKKSYSMEQLPESYSLAMALSKDERTIWLQEFNKGFFEGFSWQIGDQTLTMKKKTFAQPVKGDYVLSLNGTDYFLLRNNISITVKFDESGVSSISLDGVTKDVGTRK